ncbi:MAG: hypothetical protein AB8B96_22350 [Lysobacterales bacterium]
MTRSELIGQLRQFIVLESDAKRLLWWQRELSELVATAQQRAREVGDDQSGTPNGNGAPPPFVGTG